MTASVMAVVDPVDAEQNPDLPIVFYSNCAWWEMRKVMLKSRDDDKGSYVSMGSYKPSRYEVDLAAHRMHGGYVLSQREASVVAHIIEHGIREGRIGSTMAKQLLGRLGE